MSTLETTLRQKADQDARDASRRDWTRLYSSWLKATHRAEWVRGRFSAYFGVAVGEVTIWRLAGWPSWHVLEVDGVQVLAEDGYERGGDATFDTISFHERKRNGGMGPRLSTAGQMLAYVKRCRRG